MGSAKRKKAGLAGRIVALVRGVLDRLAPNRGYRPERHYLRGKRSGQAPAPGQRSR